MKLSDRISQLPITAQEMDVLESAMKTRINQRAGKCFEVDLEGRDFHKPFGSGENELDATGFHAILAAENNGPAFGDRIGDDSATRELNREVGKDIRQGVVERIAADGKVSYERRPRPARLYVNRQRGTMTLVKVGGVKETRYPASLEAAREIARQLVGHYRARNIALEIKVTA